MKFDKDVWGAFFSGLCLVHCLLAPVLLLLGISSVGFIFLQNEWIHYILIAPIMIMVIWSIPCGFRIHHKRIPTLFAAIGLVLFVFGLISSETFEVYFTVVASTLLIVAHLYNRHLLGGKNCLSFKKVKV